MRPAPNWIFLSVVLVSTLAGAACGGGGAAGPLSADDIARAEGLFRTQGCVDCHGENGQGLADTGPALRDLGSYWDVDRLATYLKDPATFREAHPDFAERNDVDFPLQMPMFDHLTEDQRRLLARWLLTK